MAPRQKVNQLCAFGKCTRRNIDVKNTSFTAPKDAVNEDKSREIRSHCQLIKFCSQRHMDLCLAVKKKDKPGQGRLDLDVTQASHLFETLKACGYLWAAVALLIQLMIGERADCVRQATTAWFSNFEPEASGVPTIHIPDGLNRKTRTRDVQVPADFASLLHGWLWITPLHGGKERQWPFADQPLQDPRCALFPGLDVAKGKHQGRNWHKPISERAYLAALKVAVNVIVKERAGARARGEQHVFEGINMDLIGTHSMKKSHVTLMKAAGYSATLIEKITGTQAATLDRYYDIVSPKRQAQAMQQVLGPVVQSCKKSAAEDSRFCTECGHAAERGWKFCCCCGTALSQS